MIKILVMFAQNIWETLGNKTSTLSGITIGSSVGGTAVGAINNLATIFIKTDLLSLMQYTAYMVSITVGILTIISWYRKNKKSK